jgi:8-oxo-dGTP pyrophosphatase MutT (NUDIX family)
MEPIREIPQACAVPYRFGVVGLEFCLITTRKSRRWSFPKGGIRAHETVVEAALNEALEEAGLTGAIIGEPLAEYECVRRNRVLDVTVLLMRVDDCNVEWKESQQRSRCWVGFQTAQMLLDRPIHADILKLALDRIRQNRGASSSDSAIGA